MKKTILRSLSIFLAIFFILGTIPIGASAAENTNQKYEYDIYRDVWEGTVSLGYYVSNDSDVVIPSEYDGYVVVGVNRYCFNATPSMAIIPRTISVPKTLERFYTSFDNDEHYVFSSLENLEGIYVDHENQKFSDIDGILANKSANRLIFMPQNFNVTNYTVPDKIQYLGEMSICKIKKLNSIEFEGQNKIQLLGETLSYLPNLIEAEYPNSDAKYPIFTNCPKLNKVIIPKYVEIMNELDFSNSPNVTLYVYDNTYGLEWAKSHDFPYEIIEEPQPPVEKDLVDSQTGIQVSGLIDPDAVLNVKNTENTLENAVKTFDITLEKDGNIIQPSGEITISIPCEYSDCDVFWVKDDRTKVDMNAEYVDGKYVFKTDHLSVYSLVRDSKPTDPIPGITEFTDSATGISVSGCINADLMKVEKVYNVAIDGCKQAYEISFEGLKGDILGELEFKFPVVDESLSICHISPDEKITEIISTYQNGNLTFKFDAIGTFVLYEKDSNIMGDVNLDGKTDIKDVTLIQKWIVEIVKFNEVQKKNADFNSDGIINIKDATAIQKKDCFIT